MEEAKSKVIGAAISRALLVWVAFYVVTTHVHMLLTWPKQPSPIAEESPILEAPQQQVEVDNEWKELEMASERLWQAKRQAETRQQEWLEETKQKVSLLQHNVNQMDSSIIPNQQHEGVQLPRLKNLLSQPSLEHLDEHELRAAMKEAIDEVDKVLSASKQEIAWKSIFSAEYLRDTPSAATCKSTGSSDTLPDMARESDLFSRVQNVEAALKQRRKGGSSTLTMAESTERVLEAIRQAAIEANLVKPKGENDSQDDEYDSEDDEDHGDCAHQDDVEWLVQEGLNVLQRHLDLRAGLERALSDIIEDDDEDIILDAILPSAEPSAAKNARGNAINLRHVLDTPLLSQKSPQWIDGAVDHLSGHVDLVDQTLDSFLGASNTESMGKVLVSKLLNLAGHVSVPNPYQHIDSKAGMLMP